MRMTVTMKKILIFLSLGFTIWLLSCSEKKSSSEVSYDCTTVDSSLRQPQTIAEALNLINALPKPLGLDCFLLALKPPLKVFATNSTFSAQPAQGNSSPRIFIIQNTLVLSVVPSGSGRTFLEFGELKSGQSFKAEIQFPIDNSVTYEQINNHLSSGGTNSSCVSCHFAEAKSPYTTGKSLFISNILRPDESQRVGQTFMKIQAETCNSETNKYRCDILKAIYMNGAAYDASFPY